jgi:hypothetical protein
MLTVLNLMRTMHCLMKGLEDLEEDELKANLKFSSIKYKSHRCIPEGVARSLD